MATPTKVLVIDNYDSFVYNLVYILRNAGIVTDVFRNDKLTLEQASGYSHILLSPGPGVPENAGILKVLIKKAAPTSSILGICLGHQAIAEVFGGKLYNLTEPLHGVASTCFVQPEAGELFNQVPQRFQVARYHSWSVEENNLPQDLIVTARDAENRILGIKHKVYKCWGLQFHPEAYLSVYGPKLVLQWLEIE